MVNLNQSSLQSSVSVFCSFTIEVEMEMGDIIFMFYVNFGKRVQGKKQRVRLARESRN
jgi:hypothetical protein